MKNLKSIKANALTKEQQKNICGGLLASLAGIYTCTYRKNGTDEMIYNTYSDANGSDCPFLRGYTNLAKVIY